MSKRKYNPKNGILIRNIPESIIIEIDDRSKQLSKKLNKNFTRQDYIRLILEGENAKPLIELKKDMLEEVIDRFSKITEQQINTFERYIESNEQLVNILMGSNTEGR